MKNRQQGIVLPVVLVILLIMSVLGIALIGRMTFDARAEKISEDQMQAHYLARSGLEIGKKILYNPSLQYGDKNFYLYGDLNNPDNWTLLNGILPTADSIRTNNPIVLESVLISGNNRKMTATGLYNGQKATINFNFTVGSLNSDNLEEPPTNALDAASAEVGWVHPTNGKIIHDKKSQSMPISFYVDNKIITLQRAKATTTLQSPSMFFKDNTTSLEVTNNSVLNLKANYVSFLGDIKLSGTHLGDLNLFVNSNTPSTLDGSEIDGIAGQKYGLVYFGKKVYTQKKNNAPNTYLSIVSGYYYFKNGIEIKDAIASPASDKKLIPVTDPISNLTIFNKLNTGLAGGISPGIYN